MSTTAIARHPLGVNRAKTNTVAPHLVPYQGSKRRLAADILSVCRQRHFTTLWEPFAGSAAFTIAAARAELADRYVLNDTLGSLMALWELCLTDPAALADRYASLWNAQDPDPRAHYDAVRDAYNADPDPVALLYLLARCVKNAPRFAANGRFNQSADHRRRGRKPAQVRSAATAISALLSGRASVRCDDFADVCSAAQPGDLVYLDPPWQGTTTGRDKRYHAGLQRQRLLAVLQDMNSRGVAWVLSYDGRLGAKSYGQVLPRQVYGAHLEIDAGRSSQATLSGRALTTFESLYISEPLQEPALAAVTENPRLQLAARPESDRADH